MEFTKLLLREWNVLLMAAVWTVMAVSERVFPDHFQPGRFVNRVEPVFPIAACVFCSLFIPGPWMPDEATSAQRVILGTVMGAGSYNFAGLAKRFGITPFVLRAVRPKKRKTSSSKSESESAGEQN